MSVSIFYIVEPPRYASLSPPLLASIRKFAREPVKVVGYCPEARLAEIPESILRLHDRLGAEIRPIRTEGMWTSDYPHGNKILAALDDRGTASSLFLDTDIVFAQPFSLGEYVENERIVCSPATSIAWGGDAEWSVIYDHLGLPVPAERINLLRRRRKHTFLPYYNAGMVGFPDVLPDGRRFAELWYDFARRIDGIDGLHGRRPYLDQMSLPPAIQASGLSWKGLSESHQYILGGRIRGKPLPEHPVTAIHYRYPGLLAEVGGTEPALRVLREYVPEEDVASLLNDETWFN